MVGADAMRRSRADLKYFVMIGTFVVLGSWRGFECRCRVIGAAVGLKGSRLTSDESHFVDGN